MNKFASLKFPSIETHVANTECMLQVSNFRILNGNKFKLYSTHMVDNVVNMVPLNVPGNPSNWTWPNVTLLGNFWWNKEIIVLW